MFTFGFICGLIGGIAITLIAFARDFVAHLENHDDGP